MLTAITQSCPLCDHAQRLCMEAHKASAHLEMTRYICLTIGIVVILALLLYFVREIIMLCHESCKEKRQQKLELRYKERELLIDYRNKYLKYLEGNADTGQFKTTIEDYIKEQKEKLNNYGKKTK